MTTLTISAVLNTILCVGIGWILRNDKTISKVRTRFLRAWFLAEVAIVIILVFCVVAL